MGGKGGSGRNRKTLAGGLGSLGASGPTSLRLRSPQTPPLSSRSLTTLHRHGVWLLQENAGGLPPRWETGPSGGASAQEIRPGVEGGGLRRAGEGAAGHFGAVFRAKR